MVLPKRPPDLTLETVFRQMATSGRLLQLYIVKSGDSYQVSLQRHTTRSAYKVSAGKSDVVEALFHALGPDGNDSWEAHLSLGEEPEPEIDEDDLI